MEIGAIAIAASIILAWHEYLSKKLAEKVASEIKDFSMRLTAILDNHLEMVRLSLSDLTEIAKKIEKNGVPEKK